MTKTIQCISPIDGSLYQQRQTLGAIEAHSLVHDSREAQKDWARRSIAERIAIVERAIHG